MDAGVVLVTGGSRGIGRATVEALVAGGWTVALTSRSAEGAGGDLEAAFRGQARVFVLDVRDRTQPGQVVKQIEAEMGPLVGLVNNAGLRREGLLAMTSDRDWDEVLDVNLGGVFRCCRAALPAMMHRGRGAIVNISSLSALSGLAGQTAYAASKAGVLGLTRALAREVGKRGVRVNAILPGFVPTDMTSSLSEEAIRSLRSHECLPRGTLATDVAGLVVFLLSDKAAAITGQALLVDAGTSA
jgi:3-oxoacyl-[acyl-carrier protein] reductase